MVEPADRRTWGLPARLPVGNGVVNLEDLPWIDLLFTLSRSLEFRVLQNPRLPTYHSGDMLEVGRVNVRRFSEFPESSRPPVDG